MEWGLKTFSGFCGVLFDDAQCYRMYVLSVQTRECVLTVNLQNMLADTSHSAPAASGNSAVGKHFV